jgi:hypothetical protein
MIKKIRTACRSLANCDACEIASDQALRRPGCFISTIFKGFRDFRARDASRIFLRGAETPRLQA